VNAGRQVGRFDCVVPNLPEVQLSPSGRVFTLPSYITTTFRSLQTQVLAQNIGSSSTPTPSPLLSSPQNALDHFFCTLSAQKTHPDSFFSILLDPTTHVSCITMTPSPSPPPRAIKRLFSERDETDTRPIKRRSITQPAVCTQISFIPIKLKVPS
jgi:hypothetical protein